MTNIHDILWDKSLIGLAQLDNAGKFVKVNPVFCQLVGYSESELQDKSWNSITHPDDVEGGKEMLDRLLSGEIEDYKMEKRYITKRGYVIWVDVSLDVIKEDKDVKFFLKQAVGNKIVVPDMGTKKESEKKQTLGDTFRENYKLILAAIVGTIFTIYGAYTTNDEIKNIGMALTLGIFGGIMAKR